MQKRKKEVEAKHEAQQQTVADCADPSSKRSTVWKCESVHSPLANSREQDRARLITGTHPKVRAPPRRVKFTADSPALKNPLPSFFSRAFLNRYHVARSDL